MTSVLEVIDEPGLRRIRLNRPERLNALGAEMREAVAAAVTETAEHDCRVVVLEGAGRGFCAGVDLKDVDAPSPDAPYAQRRREAGRWGRILDGIEALPQVTVASLHGPVIGGGALLAVACDLRVAAPDLRFAIPEVGLGIPLTWGGIPRLVREIGLPRTRDLILTGRTIGADEALAWGLLQRVGDGETRHLCDELLAMPPGPLATSKDGLRAHGRALASAEVAWSDPDLIEAARRDPGAEDAMRAYLERLAGRDR